jgi:hypothetical protein
VQRTATLARAARPHVRLVLRIAGDPWSDEDARAVAPYVDAVLLAGPSGPVDVRTASARFGGLDVWAWSDRRDALAGTLEGEAALRIMVPEHPAAAARALHALRDWMPPGLTPLAGVEATCDGCRSATWLHPETLQGIAVVEGVTPGATLRIAPDAVRVAYVDPARGAAPAALEVERSVGAARVRLPDDTGRQLVLAIAGWRGTEDEVYRTAVEVTAARTLTVEEIVARHQAQRARQATLVQNVIAVGHTVLTFEVPGFPGPVTVTADTTIFTRGALTEVAQSSVRVNGMDLMTDGHVPRVPIIDAERVSTPPLTIALTPLYAYELAGRERQGGRDAYVVAFRPTRQGPAFRGRAWIDAATFALLRMEAAQVALSGPIVSSEQHDEYVPVRVGDREAWLVGRSGSFQVYQAAGLRTPIHREIVTPTHLVNVAEFDTRLDEAHASRAVMLRDTPEGYRYLVPGRGSEARRGGSSPTMPGGVSSRRCSACSWIRTSPCRFRTRGSATWTSTPRQGHPVQRLLRGRVRAAGVDHPSVRPARLAAHGPGVRHRGELQRPLVPRGAGALRREHPAAAVPLERHADRAALAAAAGPGGL